MQLEDDIFAKLGGEKEAEISVFGVDADVDDAAAAFPIIVL